ncbi:uncharacterized protein LOC121256375 [Juglans microcarpa x Juglans regia]|uniref:uncharacterized protein LOC121256375 n=1 Tax=Juglans microcarpa x Juglans regia TaxID=2249226 RepID=UPI001B7EE28A|nr:uncharacterized protein LOC121256375 [Juglans microcarpa x Juglans regia]
MDIVAFLLFASLFFHPISLLAQPPNPVSRITVVGVVYCDICSSNTFSRHSYFMPGADVQLQCKFRANSPKTTEQITFSVNRTTDKHGVYTLEIPTIDGVNCVEGLAVTSLCQASLIGSPSSACNVPGLKITSNVISVKSKQDNLCIYNLNALSFWPSKKNTTLCGNQKELQNSLDSSKCFLPFFPPSGFPWPPLPQFPFPPLPPSLHCPFLHYHLSPHCPSLHFLLFHLFLSLHYHFQTHHLCPFHSHDSPFSTYYISFFPSASTCI